MWCVSNATTQATCEKHITDKKHEQYTYISRMRDKVKSHQRERERENWRAMSQCDEDWIEREKWRLGKVKLKKNWEQKVDEDELLKCDEEDLARENFVTIFFHYQVSLTILLPISSANSVTWILMNHHYEPVLTWCRSFVLCNPRLGSVEFV